LLADARHDDASAIEALRRALALAEAEELRRPFRALGADLTATVARYLDVVEGLGALALRRGDGGRPGRHGGPAAARRAVVRPGAGGLELSAVDADQRGDRHGAVRVVNTVKANLKSLYPQARRHRRREAVRRARELDLL